MTTGLYSITTSTTCCNNNAIEKYHGKRSMLIFIRVHTTGNIVTIHAKPYDTIDNIKAKFCHITRNFHPNGDQQLIFDEKQLKDDRFVSENNIQRESLLSYMCQSPTRGRKKQTIRGTTRKESF